MGETDHRGGLELNNSTSLCRTPGRVGGSVYFWDSVEAAGNLAASNANPNRINQLLNIALDMVIVLSMISQLLLLCCRNLRTRKTHLMESPCGNKVWERSWRKRENSHIYMDICKSFESPHLFRHQVLPSLWPDLGILAQPKHRISASPLPMLRQETLGIRDIARPTVPDRTCQCL